MSREIEARLKLTATDRTAAAFAAIAGRFRQVTGAAAQANAAAAMHARSMQATMAALAMYAAPAAATAGIAAAMREYAAADRRLTRIRLTAGAAASEQAGIISSLRTIANDVALPIDQVTAGLEDLVSQGRSLEQAMAFLPSIARTAQASGSAVSDIAATAGAIGDAFEITGDKMQRAFDILVGGGKAGKFELRDMSQYLPSLAPAAAAVGLKGEEGLKRLVAMLQIVRNQTGTSSEAATAMANVFQKMETEETANKFKKMGVDLRKEMARARKSGKDLTEVFLDLSEKALKGDLSKIPQLFADAQFGLGMRALLSQRDALRQMNKELGNVDGSVMKDLSEVINDSQSSFDRLANSAIQAGQSLGKFADSAGGSAALKEFTDLLDRASGIMEKLRRGDLKDAGKDVAGYLAGDPNDRGLIGYAIHGDDPKKVADADALAAANRIAKAREELARIEKIKERYGEAPLPALLVEQERAARAALAATERDIKDRDEAARAGKIYEETRASSNAAIDKLPDLPQLGGLNPLIQTQAYQEYARTRMGRPTPIAAAAAAAAAAEAIPPAPSELAASAAADLLRRQQEVMASIAKIDAKSRSPEMAATLRMPLETELADIRGQVNAYHADYRELNRPGPGQAIPGVTRMIPAPGSSYGGADLVGGFQAASDAARAAAGDIESAFRSVDAASAIGASMGEFNSALTTGGEQAINEASRIMDRIKQIFSVPLRPNIQMPSGPAAGLNRGGDVAGNGMAGAP